MSLARIAIIGVGQVGAAAAYALILGSVANELLLVDVKIDLRDGQVRDLSDVAYSVNSSTRVRAASHHEAGQCDMVVITAGSKCSPGQTSIQEASRNASVLSSVLRQMAPFRTDAIILVVANPVDVLTSLAQDLSGLPKYQVFGSGTFLDSVRLRGMVAHEAGVAADSINLSVIGVHGEPQVTAWSSAAIHGVPLDQFLAPRTLNRAELADECKHRSDGILRAKGSIPFGISSVVSSICSSVFLNKGDVRTVSHYQPEFGCCISLPAVLGRKGILRTVEMPLDEEEQGQITRSAKRLRDMVDRVEMTRDALNRQHTSF